MKSNQREYQVVLLPKLEVVEENYSLGEAQAWIDSYNEVAAGGNRVAVVAPKGPLPMGGRRGAGGRG